MTDPVLFVIDSEPHELATFERLLYKRYGADYRIIAERSPEAGLDLLERLAYRGEDVALVAADLHLPRIDGIEFLKQAHTLHRGAARGLLVAMDSRGTRIPFSELDSLQRATVLGRIDLWILKGWVSPEELVYPQIQEALSRWTRTNRPRHEVVRVIGERWSPSCHELRDALARNTVPFGFYAADSEEGHRLLRDHGVDVGRLPAVILHDGSVLHEPTLVEIADALGVHTRPSSEAYDVVILGAGPAGLTSAVYGASEGLSTLVIEPQSIGGQAGTSSMIRNYLGFPEGVSGGELTFRAWEQALLLGAQFVFRQGATGLTPRDHYHAIALSDGSEVIARTVIIASGVAYRVLGISALKRLVGAGVYYGAAGVEAPAMAGEEVYVVGGANSAGQAALHLAKFAARVTLLVRGESLAAGMSDYLINQLQATPNVHVRLRTQVVDGRGEERLETLTLEDMGTGQREGVTAAALFILIGAEPRTEWLRDVVQRDDRGYILTDRDVRQEGWPLKHPPLPFETSVPGVFAVGDARHGSVKRVASAVGEGSVAITSVHQYSGNQAKIDIAVSAKEGSAY